MTRQHERSVELNVTRQQAFELLTTPSHICAWWEAHYAVLIPVSGGLWLASWGADEDRPEYVTAARIAVWEPGRQLTLDRYQYFAKTGALPFEADFVTKFKIEPKNPIAPESAPCVLTVSQDGFPTDSRADDYYAACREGWQRTLENMSNHADQLNGRRSD